MRIRRTLRTAPGVYTGRTRATYAAARTYTAPGPNAAWPRAAFERDPEGNRWLTPDGREGSLWLLDLAQ